MRCEYLKNPIGLDESIPRFAWTLLPTDSLTFGQMQTAYRIIVADNRTAIDNHDGNIWDSEWGESDQMNQIEYIGKSLMSDRTYYWMVKVRDENGVESSWSDPAYWSTGLFNQDEWTAQWIGSDQIYDQELSECTISDPWLRKTYEIKEKPKRAIMFVASVGYHELYVNGEKIGDEILAPAVTNHYSRARYIAYDIASKLNKGSNTIALWLGTSWSIYQYYNSPDRPATPMVKAQADIYFHENESPLLRIETDATWKIHPSPNRLTGDWMPWNFGGEIWDAKQDIPDWNLTSYDDRTWDNATVYYPNLRLSSQNVEGNKLFEEIRPIAVEERGDGVFRLDMGVNFTGWTEIKLNGKPNQRVNILFSEREQDDMTFSLHSAYILDESGKGTFRNRFNYSAGRWITLTGLSEKPKLSDIRGWNVRTDYKNAATFTCSDSLQNWIYNTVKWTFENLSLGGYVVDCSQRERLGYGGDAHATAETGMFNYHMAAFYTKWMQDWRDSQGHESNTGRWLDGGILPHTAPTLTGGGGPAWGGICVTLPWYMYNHYGDKRVLESNFEMMKDWLSFLDTHVQDGLLLRYGGMWDYLSDWLWPGATDEGMNNDKPEAVCFNSCYMVYNLRVAAQIAEVLGKDIEAEKWDTKAETMSLAIHNKFYDKDDHSYCDKSMGNLTVALLANVMPNELRETVEKRLEDEILIVRDGHIHVGITGGALLFHLLREMERDDLIYSMTSKTDYPSWGYMKDNDATTIWEMWEKDITGLSLMHSSYLYPGAWYIDGIGGIRQDGQLGYNTFRICPPLLTEKQMQWAKATYESPSGAIRSAWERKNNILTISVTVPPNCNAELWFPSTEKNMIHEPSSKALYKGRKNIFSVFQLPAGTYTFIGPEKFALDDQ